MKADSVRAVLFDAAGTLILLREPVGETYARFGAAHGAAVPASRLEEAFARVVAKAPALVFPGEPLRRAAELERDAWRRVVDDTWRAADAMARPPDPERLFSDLWDHYAGASAWALAPGARDAITALRAAGLATGVVSNFDHRLRNILQELEIHHLLDLVTLPADAGAAKPDPLIFHVALKRLGLPGHDVLYVGDRVDVDEAAARAAGLRAIGMGDLATLADLPRRLGLPAAAPPEH